MCSYVNLINPGLEYNSCEQPRGLMTILVRKRFLPVILAVTIFYTNRFLDDAWNVYSVFEQMSLVSVSGGNAA